MNPRVFACTIVLFCVAAVVVVTDAKKYKLFVKTGNDGTDNNPKYKFEGVLHGKTVVWPADKWLFFDDDDNNYEADSLEMWEFDMPDEFHSIERVLVHLSLNKFWMKGRTWTMQKIDLVADPFDRFIRFEGAPQKFKVDETHSFPVKNCIADEWGKWSECDGGCLGGLRFRKRHLIAGYFKCKATGHHRCQAVGEWKQWGPCTPECSQQGKRVRRRSASAPTARVCKKLKEEETCATVGKWSNWAPCSVLCGTGKTIRQRNVTSPNDQYCEKDETKECGKKC